MAESEMKKIILDGKIENLDFRVETWVDRKTDTRIRNALQRFGVHTVSQLIELTRREVEAVPGIGIVCTVVIEKRLHRMGLRLRRST